MHLEPAKLPETLHERVLELLRQDKARFEEFRQRTHEHPFTRKPIQPGDLIDPFPPGASDRKLNAFTRRTGVPLSESMRALLKITNGGAFYGVRPLQKSRDVERVWDARPDWRKRSWFPVADDGCGNFYVQPNCDAVCFVDMHHFVDEVAYVAASDMLHFAVFYLEAQQRTEFHRELARELGYQIYLKDRRRGADRVEANPWPFGKRYMLHRDPNLKLITDLPLAWDKP